MVVIGQFAVTGRWCNIRPLSHGRISNNTRKPNWMDSIIRCYHCNCGFRKPPFHSRMRMYNTYKNHWLLPPHQSSHQRHFISIFVYSFHVKFRNYCSIMVQFGECFGRTLLLCLPLLLLLFSLYAAINPPLLVLPLVCRKLQVEFCWRRRSGPKTLASYYLYTHDLVFLTSFRNTNRILVDRSQAKVRRLLQKQSAAH